MKKVFQRMLALCFAFTLCLGLFQTDIATVSVQAKTKTVGILISEKNTTLIKGQKHTLYVTGTTKKVSWSSTNKKVATVSKKGVVTAKKKGNAVIKAKVGKKILKCKVKVTVVGLNYTTISLGKGDTKTLKLLNNKKKVTWKSKNKNICSVSTKGKLKARKKGNTVIYAKVGKKNYKCKVIVKDNVVKKKDKNGTYNFEYNPTVKKEELSKEKSYTVSQVNNELQISVKKDKATSSVKAGDVVVMPKNNNNESAAMKVKAVVSQGNKLVYVGEAAEYTDVFEKIDIDSNKNFTFDGFECAPGIKENNAKKKYASRRYNSSLSLNYDNVTVTISRESLKAEIKEGNATGTIEVLKPSLDSDIDIDINGVVPNVKKVKLAVTQVCKNTISYSGSVTKEVFLGHQTIPVAYGFYVDYIMYLKLSANGDATVITKTTTTIGAQYSNKTLNNLSDRSFEFEKREAHAGGSLIINPMIDLRWMGFWDENEHEAKFAVEIIRVGAEVGPKVTGEYKGYNTKPFNCIDIHLWLYLSIYLDKEYGVTGLLCKLADVNPYWTILDDNASNPLRKTFHIEDGKVVSSCTHNNDSGENSSGESVTGGGSGGGGGVATGGEPSSDINDTPSSDTTDTPSTTRKTIQFGQYWQEDTNGDDVCDKQDEKQPITWQVLSVDSQGNALLLADKILDARSYHRASGNVTWETCTLRTWLNGLSDGQFLSEAFTEQQRTLIKNDTVLNDGNNTTDYVFLLSVDEINNKSYGFIDNSTRKTTGTGFAKDNNLNLNSGCGYWLRSRGWLAYYAVFVKYDGSVNSNGADVSGNVNMGVKPMGVRPAIRVNLNDIQ